MECSRGRRDSDSGTVDQPTMTGSREMLGTMSEEKLFWSPAKHPSLLNMAKNTGRDREKALWMVMNKAVKAFEFCRSPAKHPSLLNTEINTGKTERRLSGW